VLYIRRRHIVKKDRFMDRHDRVTPFDGDVHQHDTTAHTHTPTGMALQQADRPSLLAESDIELVFAHADKFPNGATLLSCGINTGDESSTYSVDFQIRSTPDDATPTAVETVATAGSKVAEDDGTLSATAVAVGEYVYAVLPTTEVDRVNVWITYTID
jgi:hypothetical protein